MGTAKADQCVWPQIEMVNLVYTDAYYFFWLETPFIAYKMSAANF